MAFSKLLVATKNPGKTVELQEMLHNSEWEIVDLSAYPEVEDVEETGQTFAENALLKAHYYHKMTGLLSLSDDSGLAVDALDGAPGVYSARYAGKGATDRERYEKLLHQLSQTPTEERTARFICVLALVGNLNENFIEKTFTGTVEGRILTAPQGEQGFGYDPIFEYPPLSKSFAQLSRTEKATISHRGRALSQFLNFLKLTPR